MNLNEAKQILKKNGYIIENTSIYSELSDFYRYLKVKAPKTGYDLEIEGDENSIIVKFMDNVAKVTLEKFDDEEDPMLYVEVEDDERIFYNEHTDYGNALQFIIKNICPTNESKKILKNAGFICEEFELVDTDCKMETVGDLIEILKRVPKTWYIKIRQGNTDDVNIGMIAQSIDDNGNSNREIVLFAKE